MHGVRNHPGNTDNVGSPHTSAGDNPLKSGLSSHPENPNATKESSSSIKSNLTSSSNFGAVLPSQIQQSSRITEKQKLRAFDIGGPPNAKKHKPIAIHTVNENEFQKDRTEILEPLESSFALLNPKDKELSPSRVNTNHAEIATVPVNRQSQNVLLPEDKLISGNATSSPLEEDDNKRSVNFSSVSTEVQKANTEIGKRRSTARKHSSIIKRASTVFVPSNSGKIKMYKQTKMFLMYFLGQILSIITRSGLFRTALS